MTTSSSWRISPTTLIPLVIILGLVVVALSSEKAAVAFVVVLALVLFTTVTLVLPYVTILMAIILSATAGGLSGISLPGIPFTLSGTATTLIGISAVTVLLGFINRIKKRWLRANFALFLFMVWAIIRTPGSLSVTGAIRDVGLFAIPVIMGLVTTLVIYRKPGLLRVVEKFLVRSSIVPLAVAGIGIFLSGSTANASGLSTPLGRRTVALFLLVILAIVIVRWRVGTTPLERRSGLIWTVLITGFLAVTLSRTVLAVVIVVYFPLAFIFFRMHKFFRASTILRIGLLGLLVVVTILLAFQHPAVRERFFYNAETATISDLFDPSQLNSQGRFNVWPLVWQHALQRPFVGHGTGSARLFVNTVSNWGNPHNDYLRIFHDLGAIGLLLFVFAWAERLIRHWKGWRKLRLAAPHLGKYHLAAFCAGTAIGVSFLTDNTLVYAFVMVPFFILSGMAIAASDLYFRPANAIVHQPLPDQLPVPTTVGP